MTLGEKKVLRYLNDTGSSWAPIDKIDCDVINDVQRGKLCLRQKFDRFFVTFPYYKEMEEKIADMVVSRLRPVNVDTSLITAYIRRFEQEESARLGFSFNLSPEQEEGVITLLQNRLAILTGGPGTGKTSVLKCVAQIIHWIKTPSSISFTAPTGKAARRVKESTGFFAVTVQSAIKDSGEEIQELRAITSDNVFTDEVSILDMETFYKLLLSLSPWTKLYLIGDVDQLPSVGIGAILRDLIDCGIVPCCQLEKNFRQDNDLTLFENIQIVKKGCYLPLREGHDFRRIKTEENCFDNSIKLYLEGVKEYGSENTVILTPYRKEGTVCSERINEKLQRICNPIGTAIHTTVIREDGRKLNMTFRVGDPVIQLVNRGRIANGDVGYITQIKGKEIQVQYTDCIVRYYPKNYSELDLAYAISIHKAQGSEYKCVIIPFLRENQNLDRNMIYTGITRAKSVVTVIGEDEVIMDACKLQSAWERHTFLCEEILLLVKSTEIAAVIGSVND